MYKSENFVSIKALNKDMRYINVLNGLYNIRTGQLEPHSPSVYSTIQLPIVYNPSKTDSPIFDSYLDTLCDGIADKKQFLLEYMGACLFNIPGKKFKKSLFMFGEGDTGKSIIKSITEQLLGEGNYMGIDLRQLEARFGSASIFGKRLAGSADVSFMTVAELNIFKQATGGNSIQGERKCKDAFEFIYDGLFWFAMNRLPKFGGDDGEWVYKRIIPFYCSNPIPDGQKDKDLLDKIFEQEKQAIFNKAIKGLRAVIDNDYTFHEPAESAIIRKNYRIDNNSALDFFHTMMEKRDGDVVWDDKLTVSKVYKAYKSWYSSMNPSGHYIKTMTDFYCDISDFLGIKYDVYEGQEQQRFLSQ